MNRTALIVTAFLILATGGAALAQSPVAVDDSFNADSGYLLAVEAPGVLENDYNAGGEPPPPAATSALVDDVMHGVLVFRADGSFDYTSDVGYIGVDTVTYNFTNATGTSNTATVTLIVDGCEPDALPTQWVCWVEQAYLAKAAELGLSTFVEGFEDDVAWATARTPSTAPSVVSKGITWQSNLGTNGITTGGGPARNGEWAVYSLPHGVQTGAPTDPTHDGFTGTAASPDSVLGVGGWLIASQVGSRIELIVTHDGGGTTTAGFRDHSLTIEHRFFGFIDTAGFTSFEVLETDGNINQPYFVFGDDFIFVGAGNDTTPPQVVEIGSWEETADGVITEGEIIDVAITELMVRFSEPVQDPPGDTDPDDATNPANYLLFSDGGDGFQTVDCAGGIAASDTPITVEVLQYLSGEPSETWLFVNSGIALGPGPYRLLTCGTTSILDWAGYVLDGDGNGTGGDDFVRNFEIASGPVPSISIDDVAVVEGDVGTTDATFTISLSTTSSSQVTVNWATSGGTATSGVDFLAASGTATFPPQTLAQTVNVLVVGDLEPEIDEGYTVDLSAPVNAVIGDGNGAGTIIDDDAWTWFVAPDGHDGNDCLTWPTACLTIGEAVLRSASGDQINVARGTYNEHLVLDVDLTLVGEPPMGTVVDGSGVGSVVSIAPGVTVSMQSFEIRGGGDGGVFNEGDLTLEDCWIHDNGDASPTSFGGLLNQGTAVIDRVSVDGNLGYATSMAGGVSNSGQLTIRNSTISENSGGNGSGIVNQFGASLDLVYATVAYNGNLGIIVGDPGSTSMRGTVVADHFVANCDSAVTTLGHNLEDRDTCGLQPSSGDLISVNPLLAPLGHHGGTSPTHAIAIGSPALDAGESAGFPAVDQRGVSRPQDGDLSGTATADIGAFEALPGAIFDDGFESGDTGSWN